MSDLTAIIGADTRLLEEALRKAVAKPYKLNFSVDQGASGALGRIRSQLGEFDKSLAASNARVMAFSLSASSMFAVTKSLKEMVRVTVEVERKMTSINSILGAGRSQFKQFGNDLFKIARDTATSFDEVTDAAEELARQGVGIEETLKRTSSAMKLAKVSGVEVKTAVDAITAALNSNNDAWLDSEKLINKLVAVDAKFAVSAGGLAEAIKRVGSVAADAGLDIDDLVAAITSAQQTTARGEAVIGNALKTIFTRAQRPKVLEDFESLGIATKDAVGNMRPLAGVLTEVAKRYDDLSSAQQQSVSELVGGVYQINILKALFRDLGKETSFFGSALKTSKNATNEADRRIAELNETLDSLFKKLTVNLTQVGSDVGSNVFGPLFKNLLKSANAGLEQVNRDINGESGQIFGKSFEAILKGVGNTLNSPILIGGFVTISRFLLQTAREGREAIKTLAGLNNSFHSLEVVSADAANWLRQNPKYLQDIVIASKSAEGATRALTAATAAYNKEVSQRAALDAAVGTHASAIARAAGIVAIPGRGGTERLQPKKAAVGLIPQAQEMAGAYAGGYKPGQVKDMNVPGMGRVYYNTAEKVKWFPGMAQPAIMPPQSSRAGRNYEQNFAQTHGFNPYMAGGMIPNFAKKDIIQRIGKKEIFNRFAKHYGQGRDYEGFYNIHGEEFNRKNLTPEEAKIYANITSAISPSVPDYVAAQFAAPIFNKYLQTKSTNVDDYLDLPPTRRVSRHKNVGSLGLFGIKGTLSSSGNIRTRDDARRAGLSKALSGLDLGSDDTAKTRHYARGILQDRTAFPIDTNVIQAILGGKKPSKKEAAKLIALANEFAELNQITSGASGLQAAIFKSNSSHREKYSEQSVRSALSGIQRMSGGFVPNFTSRIVGSGKNLFVTSLYDALGGEFGGGPEYPFVKKGKGAAFLAQGKTTEMIKMIRPYIESGGDVIFGAHVGGDPIEGIKGNRFIHDKIHEELPYLKGESSGASTEALGKLFNQYKKKIDERAGGVKGRGLKTLRSIISPFIEPDILDFYQKNPEFGGSVSRLVKFGPESLAPTASEHHLYPHAIAGQALGRINPVNIEGLFARAGNLDKKQIAKLFGLVRIPRIPIGIAYNQGDETHKSLGFANSGLVPNFANIYSRTSMGSGMASITGKTAEIMRISTEEDGRGGSGEIYSDLFKAFRSHKVKAVIGKLIPQNREPRENTDVSRVKAILPQITRARFGKKSILGVGNSEIHLGAKTFDKDLAANASLILDQLQMDAEYPFLSTYLNKGLVPNFAWSKTNEMPKEFLAKYPESKAAIHKGRMYSPEVRKMLQKLQLGGQPLDRNLLDALIERDIPIREVVPPSSIEDLPSESLIKSALDIKQAERIGKLKELSAGVPITVRQDVPSMTRKGVGVVKTEGPEGFRSYDSFVVFDNPTMRSSAQLEKASLSIGAGKDKAPLLKISGKLAEQQSLPRDLNNWTQVGFNPDRHSYYYDRKTKTPVIGGSKAVQIGNTVFVKDAEFGKREDFLYSTGLIPNFSPLSAAISRESAAVNPGLIRVGSHSALRGPGNPDGMGVYNLRDEPLGLGQGVERAKSMGLNPKTHGIPNYANGGIRQWLGRQKEAYMGNESSPDPGNKFMGAMALSMAAPAISTFGGNLAGTKMGEEAVNALSLYFTLSTFLRGPKGGKAAIGISAISGLFGILKQANNSFNTLDSEVQVLRDNIQKASGGLNKYVTTLEQLQESYLNNNVSSEKIGKLQNKLAESLSQLPAELRGQLIGAKSGGQVQEIIGRYTESQDAKLREKEFAMGLSSLLNEQSILRRGSLLGFGEAGTKTGKEKLDAIADSLLGSLSESGLKKIGGAAGLGSGGLLSVLGAAGLGGSTLTQLARVNPDELKTIQARMVGEQGSRESDVQKFKALAPQRQREIEQAQMLEKRMKGARDVIRQTFEQIGQFANMRATMMGRRGIMNAAGIGEQIQGVAGLIGETGSPTQAAMANYKAQIAANQIQAASGISNVFGGLRGGISTLFSNTDLTRMGDIPARMRAGQGSLMNILGGSSVSGIGEGAISLFKSLGKDDDVAEIKKLMADSNEKLVEIYQTLEEQNKLAEIQKNIALQRAEFERTLKVGGGLGSFMDRGVKMQQLTDIYSGKFGVQTGIFKGQGSIDLLKSFLGAGGQAGAPGFSKLLGVATEARAQDIISSQKDLNRAFQGTGLSLGVPSLADARKVAETQIAAELKTGDSAMEKQMAQLQAALANTLSSSMGGQFNNAAQVFANVLAGSSTFIELNSTINSTQEVLKTLDATLKSLQGGAGYGVRAGGNIPISAAATEKMMAKAGGYNPGYIRRAGNLIYNSAERVDYLPGVREPIISPPPGSLAGFLHRQNLNAAFGFAAVGGPSMGNIDPKLAAFWANYSVDAKTGTYRNKKTGKFISHREANELMGRKIFYMPDAPVQTTPPGQQWKAARQGMAGPFNLPPRMPKSAAPFEGTGLMGRRIFYMPDAPVQITSPGQQWKAKRQSIAGPFNLPEKGSLIPFSISEMSAKASQSSGMTMPTISYNQGIKASGLPISSAQFISPPISPTVGSSLRLSPNVDFTSGTGKPITVSPQAPSLVTQAIATSARAAKAGYPVTDFADIDDYYNRAFANQYLDPIGPQQPPSKMIRGGYRPPTSNYFQFLKEAKTNMGGLGAALKSQVSYKGIMGGLKGAFGPASLALSVADVGSDFLNPRMVDKARRGKRLKLFGTDYSQVGEKYLGEQYGMIDNFENMSTFAAPGKGSLYGTAFGMVTDPVALTKHFGLRSNVFDLMESEGDVAVSQKRLALSQAKKLEVRAKSGDKMAAAQLKMVRGDIAGDYQARRSGVMEMIDLNARTPNEQPFVPGRVTYSNMAQLNEAYHARNKSTLADKTLAVERATSKYETPLEKIGSLRSNLKAMSAGHAWRPAFEEDLKNRSVQYNADIIAKMFGINDPKQLQRLQVGVRGAMESGNLQGYVKSLGKPVAQPATATEKSEKQAAGAKTELNVNVNMGGNLGIKSNNVQFSEEQQLIINDLIAQVAKGLRAEIDAIVKNMPHQRSDVANVRNPVATS